MGILTANEDLLRGDKLKYDPLKTEYDPVGKAASNRIRIYDKDLGFAMHPEEKDSALKYKDAVDSAAAEKQGLLDKYKTTATKSLKAADEKAQGLLGKAENAVNNIKPQTLDLVGINVISRSGEIEATYKVPKAVAEELGADKQLTTSWSDDKKSFNVSVDVQGHIQGQELHEALGKAADQTTEIIGMYRDNYNTAREAGNIQVDALRSTVDTQSGIAWNAYNQSVSQGNQVVGRIQEQWTTFVADQRAAFQEGVRNNTGGIADLLNSGALTLR